jgi:tetratricopeptide (TPR) repeat protein
MEEGGPPPDRVSIERVCSGGTYREGYTDSKGYFSIQLGAQNAIFADASMDNAPNIFGNNGMNSQSNSMSQNSASLNSLYSCELRASLPGFHSESVSLATRRSMDNGDIGVIILKRMVKVDGYTTSATIALAPKDARKSYEKGLGYIKKNKPDEAQTEFLHAVELFPRHAGAWFELGKVYEQRDHPDEARDAYHKANAADGNFVNPYERLYLMAVRDGKWTDVADLSDKVMRLNPYDFPSSYYYNALANANLQRWDVAEKSAREAAKIRGTEAMPKSLFILGFVQANKGDLPGSVETLHSYLKTGPVAADRDRAQKLLGAVQQDLDAKNQTAKAPVTQR